MVIAVGRELRNPDNLSPDRTAEKAVPIAGHRSGNRGGGCITQSQQSHRKNEAVSADSDDSA
jgi:hypothetical protein